jgi:BON domain
LLSLPSSTGIQRSTRRTSAWAAKDGAVTLSGYVPSDADKVAAVRAAERVDGVQALADDVAVQLRLPGKFTDAEIAEQIACRRSWNPEIPATIEAEVADGHVTLRGEVSSSDQRKLAESAVRNLLGVRDVANEIRVSPPAADDSSGKRAE